MDYKEYSDSELYQLICESNEDAKEILYNKYKYIIDAIVRKYQYSAKKLGFEYTDLYQEALVGFTDALIHYDESKNTSIPTFLSLCVERRLQNAVLKAGRLKNKIMLESLSLDHVYEQYQMPLSDIISDRNENDPLLGITKEEEFEELVQKIKAALSDSEYEVYNFLINGLSYQDIALLINKSPKQVDNTIQRLKNKIKLIVNGKKD